MNDEERKKELENEIAGLKQSMEHTGYGSRELRILESLEKELQELEMCEKKQYKYEVEEWSQDTRKWVFTSDKKLTEEKILNLFYDGVHMDEDKTQTVDGVSVTYHGTFYGDNCEVEASGDFKEEE